MLATLPLLRFMDVLPYYTIHTIGCFATVYECPPPQFRGDILLIVSSIVC